MTPDFYGRISAGFVAVMIGILLGAVYDVLRILRLSFSEIKNVSPRYRELLYPKKKLSVHIPSGLKKLISGTNTVAVAVGDIVFWLAATASMIIFQSYENEGVLRIYFIIFPILGFIAYYNTVGRLVFGLSGYIIFTVRCLVLRLCIMISTPFIYIFSLLKKALTALYKNTVLRAVAAIRNTLYDKAAEKEKAFTVLYIKNNIFTAMNEYRKGEAE